MAPLGLDIKSPLPLLEKRSIGSESFMGEYRSCKWGGMCMGRYPMISVVLSRQRKTTKTVLVLVL